LKYRLHFLRVTKKIESIMAPMFGMCVPPPPPSFFPNMSFASIPFLAASLLKLSRGEKLSAEETDRLSGLAEVPDVPKSPNKIKIISKAATPVAPAAPAAPAPAAPAAPAPTTSYTVTKVDAKLCIARKVDDKDHIPGTDAAKVYPEKQCIRKRAKGELLCNICAKMEEKWQESKGRDKKWHGRLGDPVPEHLHIVGSKWYHEKYPHGITATSAEAAAPAPPAPENETLLDEEAPVKEIVWKLQTIEGVPMIRHLKNGRVYKADMNQEGEDRILWDQYQGRWNDDEGEIDYYAPEEDDE
jgi:hypothetical protein